MIAEGPDFTGIYRRGIDSEALGPDEKVRFESLLAVYFSNLEDCDHQYKSDLYFDEDDDEDLVEFMAPEFKPMLESSHGSEWWERTAQTSSTPSFYATRIRLRHVIRMLDPR